MQCQILLVIHNWIQENLEGESGNLSEVTEGFSPCNPAIIIRILPSERKTSNWSTQISFNSSIGLSFFTNATTYLARAAGSASQLHNSNQQEIRIFWVGGVRIKFTAVIWLSPSCKINFPDQGQWQEISALESLNYYQIFLIKLNITLGDDAVTHNFLIGPLSL